MRKKIDIKTSRYNISIREHTAGGPGGYESKYLTSEGDAASKNFYKLIDELDGNFLPASNRMLRSRNGANLTNALSQGKSLGIASGFKPSGSFHFGHKLASSAVSFFQKNGVQIFMPVADLECMLDSGLSREQYMYTAADNLLDWGANGVNLDATYVYLQSQEHRVSNLAYLLARGLSFDLPIDIYGAEKMIKEFPFLFAGITQVGDICLPQHKSFGNYHSFMVSGQDQDGHMKMTSELVKRALKNGVDLEGVQTLPSGLYIPHIRGIVGKASSSKPKSTIYLGPGPFNENLDDRITSSIDKIDNALQSDNFKANMRNAALDMVRYIDDFNIHSKVNFSELVEYIPRKIRDKLKNADPSVRQSIMDSYLLDECRNAGQDNAILVREVLPEVLENHHKKRKIILDYAISRADYRDQGAWVEDSDLPIKPEFWNVNKSASIDEKKMAGSRWFEIIAFSRDKITA